jgi:hypothetical protein
MSEPRHDEGPGGAITAPEDDPRIFPTIVAGLVGVVLVVLLLLGLEVLHYRTQDALVERSFAEEPAALARIVREQRALLSGYRWVDRERGTVAIPIERAMALVVAEAAAERGVRGEP